ncbi:MAG: tRNA 2-thiouridine(34) synthase MnmA [Clostridia bacterium]|nr:tRNA 2-thiouridine(34) synthase MnmA [Clostridia bacterium]
MKKAMIAMSGGVDSSVAALLTLREGTEAIGGTMRLFDRAAVSPSEKVCGSHDDVQDAKGVCDRLGIGHFVFDMQEEFENAVMRRFADIYRRGDTPNPCILCNRFVKFGGLLRRALNLGCDAVVTGHYARVAQDSSSGRWLLQKAVDTAKDQTYFLYGLNQYQLAHTLLPLGTLTKPEVRRIAEENGFANARRHDSQDICFIPDGDYVAFLERFCGEHFPGGDFVDKEGQVIGHHKGTIRYTIGQRKGLGMGFNKPMYVCAKDVAARTVTLGDNADLFSREVSARDINLIAIPRLNAPLRVIAKVRYSQREEPALLEQTGEDALHLTFDHPQRAVAPGQAVVCYDADDGVTVIGGGTIVS